MISWALAIFGLLCCFFGAALTAYVVVEWVKQEWPNIVAYWRW